MAVSSLDKILYEHRLFGRQRFMAQIERSTRLPGQRAIGPDRRGYPHKSSSRVVPQEIRTVFRAVFFGRAFVDRASLACGSFDDSL
jgi:hypothetical protein